MSVLDDVNVTTADVVTDREQSSGIFVPALEDVSISVFASQESACSNPVLRVEEPTVNVYLVSESEEVLGILSSSQYFDVDQDATNEPNENKPADEEDSRTVNTMAASDDDEDYERGQYLNSMSKKKPARPCPFCGKFLPRLTRHLKTVHKDRD